MMSFTIVLIDPQIPPNTGNIARLCAATDTKLHLVGDIGFELDDKHLRRAGLDYWTHVRWERFEDTDAYLHTQSIESCHFLTTKSTTPYWDVDIALGDSLIFGSETRGLDEAILKKYHDRTCTIPMANKSKGVRSLNLSTSVGIVLYDAIRRNHRT